MGADGTRAPAPYTSQSATSTSTPTVGTGRYGILSARPGAALLGQGRAHQVPLNCAQLCTVWPRAYRYESLNLDQ